MDIEKIEMLKSKILAILINETLETRHLNQDTKHSKKSKKVKVQVDKLESLIILKNHLAGFADTLQELKQSNYKFYTELTQKMNSDGILY